MVTKTREHRFWSIYDLDGTYAAGSVEARRKVRAWSEKRGALIFSTARTPELVMSSGSYKMSCHQGGFDRPAPKWLVGADGEYQYAALETLPLFDGQLDPDAIYGFGEGIYLAGPGCSLKGYAPYSLDRDYERNYLDLQKADGTLVASKSWRHLALDLVRELGLEGDLSLIDRQDAYLSGKANVGALKFRVQLDFRGPGAVERKYKVLSDVQKRVAEGPLAGRLEGVDESKPSDDPHKNRATLYLMPPAARKEDMVNRSLIQTCRHARLQTSQVRGVMAGDMLTDMLALCEGGLDADITGILVGGSPLNKCIQEKTDYAAVDLRTLHASLIPSGRDGFYYYDNPLTRGGMQAPRRRRSVIIGDLAYPGTIGAETIWAYIEEHQQTLAA